MNFLIFKHSAFGLIELDGHLEKSDRSNQIRRLVRLQTRRTSLSPIYRAVANSAVSPTPPHCLHNAHSDVWPSNLEFRKLFIYEVTMKKQTKRLSENSISASEVKFE